MMLIHVLGYGKGENLSKLAKKLKPCPICGRKAFLYHDALDGFDFGYSVGCPKAKIADGIHGLNDFGSFHAAQIVIHGLFSADQAVKTWNDRCKKGAGYVGR